MSDVHRLPPELWRIIIAYATSGTSPIEDIINRDCTAGDQETKEELPCLKNVPPLTPVLYHRQPGAGGGNQTQSAIQSFTQANTKRALALVCRTFHRLTGEFLFRSLYISSARSALRLASTLESSSVSYADAGKWTRHVTIVGVFFSGPTESAELAGAALRILAKTRNLESFHLRWNATSREFREREGRIIEAVSGCALRHFEWECTGGGFERVHDHAFYRMLRNAGGTLRVLKLSGYLPLAEVAAGPMVARQNGEGELIENGIDANPNLGMSGRTDPLPLPLPHLTHLKIRRSFRDDLLFISQWSISTHLTCLHLGSIWTYFDHRELAFSFFSSSSPLPSLRCLHLGEGSNVAPPLARKILMAAPRLRTLEYFYLGEWSVGTWRGVRHGCLEEVKVHVSHPVIALRSLFNSARFSREQQWEKILGHVSPFLGPGAFTGGEGDGEGSSDGDVGLGLGLEEEERTEYSAMRRVVFMEYTRNFEQLRYEPFELVEWLRERIQETQIETEVELLVEAEDYIR